MKKKLGQAQLRNFFLLIIITSVFFYNSCASWRKPQKQNNYLQYNTLALSFKFIYPSKWYVFETDNGVRISNDINILTKPESGDKTAVLMDKGLNSILYYTDVEELKKMFDDYQDALVSVSAVERAQEPASKKNETAEQKSSITDLAELSVFAEFAKAQEKKRLENLYKDAFFQEIGKAPRGAYFDDVLLMVAPTKMGDKQDLTIGLHITAVRKTKNGYAAGYVGSYNTGIVLTSEEKKAQRSALWKKDLLQTDKESLLLLQNIIRLMRTVQKDR